MNKLISVVLAIFLTAAIAEIPATQTDIDYDFGPLEIVDDIDEDEQSVEPYVYIEVLTRSPVVTIGDEITMMCVVVGLDDIDYKIQWQYCKDIDLEDYQNIDCNDPEYTFTTTYENVGYYYRVVVTY